MLIMHSTFGSVTEEMKGGARPVQLAVVLPIPAETTMDCQLLTHHGNPSSTLTTAT
jgi:hypothetical protein